MSGPTSSLGAYLGLELSQNQEPCYGNMYLVKTSVLGFLSWRLDCKELLGLIHVEAAWKCFVEEDTKAPSE